MTATQAPTPGPLSGDDDLLPCPFCEGDVIVTDSQECQDAETYYWHRCAGCGVESEGAHGASAARDQWNMRPQPFRLAPTAPVEASGSEEIGDEYEAAAHCVTLAECPPGLFFWNGTLGFKSDYGAMEPVGSNFKTWKMGSRADAYCADSGEYFWGGTSNHDDRAKVLVMPIDAATVAMVASHGPAALRPQPSGETREAVAELIEAAIVRHDPTIPLDSTLDDADAILALLSARPPARAEGQEGEVADEEDDDDDPHSPCSVCGDEYPDGVLEDGRCPSCCDKEED